MSNPMNDLVPMLKEYLDISNSDRDYTKELINDLKKTTEAMRECAITMKLQLKELEVVTKDRDASCKAKHESIDKQLESIPPKEMMEKRDKELNEMKKQLDSLLPRLYTAIAICTGVGGILGLGTAFAFKQVFG